MPLIFASQFNVSFLINCDENINQIFKMFGKENVCSFICYSSANIWSWFVVVSDTIFFLSDAVLSVQP